MFAIYRQLPLNEIALNYQYVLMQIQQIQIFFEHLSTQTFRSIVFCNILFYSSFKLIYNTSIKQELCYDKNMRQQSKSKTLGNQSRKGGAVPTLTHQRLDKDKILWQKKII